jgi:hypothetical protein
VELKDRVASSSVLFHVSKNTVACSKLPAEAGGFNPPKGRQ